MRIGLVLSEAFTGLRRNASMVVSVILVTFISLTFVGTAALLQLQIGQMKDYWYDRTQVAVYLCTETSTTNSNCSSGEATQAQKDKIKAQLESPELKPYVDTVYFEDRQQAYDNYQKQFKGTASANFLTADYLPESYRIKLHDPREADVIIESLAGTPGIDEVKDQRRYLEPIFNALNIASFTSIGIAALMLIAAALLIATTIRLSAFSRRRELGIMRLVGASNRFIQTPFVLEGVFAGLIGAVLACGTIVAVVHFFVKQVLQPKLTGFVLVGIGDAALIVPLILVIGVLLAAVSAGIAIRRYLRV